MDKIKWPEFDALDVENETTELIALVDYDPRNYWKWTTGWQLIANEINERYGNNRSATACRKKYYREWHKLVARQTSPRTNGSD